MKFCYSFSENSFLSLTTVMAFIRTQKRSCLKKVTFPQHFLISGILLFTSKEIFCIYYKQIVKFRSKISLSVIINSKKLCMSGLLNSCFSNKRATNLQITEMAKGATKRRIAFFMPKLQTQSLIWRTFI